MAGDGAVVDAFVAGLVPSSQQAIRRGKLVQLIKTQCPTLLAPALSWLESTLLGDAGDGLDARDAAAAGLPAEGAKDPSQGLGLLRGMKAHAGPSGSWHINYTLPVQNTQGITEPRILTSGLAWAFSTGLPSLFVEKAPVWKLLYHSRAHGLSYNRFQHHCFKYPGPTIILFRTADVRCLSAVVGTIYYP